MKLLPICIAILISLQVFPQSEASKINWLGFEEAMKKNAQTPKPIIIDMYTDWCGWCKKLDANTFSNKDIIAYVNEHFYAVKFNAETTDDIMYKDSLYKNNYSGKLDANGRPLKRKSHSLAEILLGGRMSYPTIVYMVTEKDMIAPLAGYVSPEDIEPILLYFGAKIYNMNQYDAFKKGLSVEKILK